MSTSKVKEERQKLEVTKDVIKKAWDTELKCYENGLKQPTNITSQDLNPFIFPYHKACYHLLDIYMCLEGEFPYKIPMYITKSARNPTHLIRHVNAIEEECYLPNSAFAVWSSLVPSHRAPNSRRKIFEQFHDLMGLSGENQAYGDSVLIQTPMLLAADYLFLNEWSKDLLKRTISWYRVSNECNGVPVDEETNDIENGEGRGDVSVSNKIFGDLPLLESLPKGHQTKILLKLLKHSMSDLQRDHNLARAVLLAMIEYRCFDGEQGCDAFRYFLLTVASEFIHDCDSDCLDREVEDDEDENELNHICPHWRSFTKTLCRVISWGFTNFTSGHAMAIAAFMDDIFDAFGWTEQKNLSNLIGWDDEDFTHATDTPLEMVRSFLEGFIRLTMIFRRRAFKLIGLKYSGEQIGSSFDEGINTAVSSHLNCIEALVSIGESVLKRLKATPVTETIGSLIVTGLTLSHVDLSPTETCLDNDRDMEGHYLGLNCLTHSPILIDATRYEVLIKKASCLPQLRLMRFKEHCGIFQSHCVEHDPAVSSLFLSPPSSEVQTVVKGLFLRQLVESSEAGCGYGDFLVWTGSPVTPYDDLLYEHNVNFPNNAGYEDTPFKLEDGTNMRVNQIEAMYDLSLLMMRRGWMNPWTPESHNSFQKPFRDAIKTIALCAYRHHMPLEICIAVNSYLSRDWWPDERTKCWYYDCQIQQLQSFLFRREDSKVKAIKCRTRCEKCHVAHACSEKHLKAIYRDGHRRECKTPPMRIPNDDDMAFCAKFDEVVSSGLKRVKEESSEMKVEIMNVVDADADGVEDEDEEGEWESIASGDDVTEDENIPEMVLNYFETRAYRIQKREEHAFASHYNQE